MMPAKDNDLNPVTTTGSADARKRRGRIAVAAISLCIGLAMIEIGFRVLAPAPYFNREILPDGVPFQTGPNGLLQYQPSATFYSQYDPRGLGNAGDARVEYRINRLGFRGVDIPNDDVSTVRIVCLGDSFTFGEGVAEASTWPSRLQDRLVRLEKEDRSDRRYRVINAGVQGHGLLDYLLNFGIHEDQFKADIVILAFFMNDLMPQHKTIELNDASHRDVPLSGLARWSRVIEFMERRAVAKQQYAELIDSIQTSFDQSGRATFIEATTGFKHYLEEQQIGLMVAIYPILWRLDENYPLQKEHRFIRDALEEAKIPYVDLLRTFNRSDASSLWAHPTDQHPNADAQDRAAEAIFKKLIEIDWLEAAID